MAEHCERLPTPHIETKEGEMTQGAEFHPVISEFWEAQTGTRTNFQWISKTKQWQGNCS